MLCLCFRLPTWEPGRVECWQPAWPTLGIEENANWDAVTEMWQWIESGGLVEGHNVQFERSVWKHHMVPRGWPAVPHTSWRCSAAKAASHALPRGLADAADALNLDVRKDEEGTTLMRRITKPRKPTQADWRDWGRQHAPCEPCSGSGRVGSTKKDGTPSKKGVKCERCHGTGWDKSKSLPPMPTLWFESVAEFDRLIAYCKQDVLAEEALSHVLPDLSPDETDVFLLDALVNERGYAVDDTAITVALELLEGEFADLNAELRELTGGAVERASQRARLLTWLESQGCELENTKAETVTTTLERPDLQPVARRALEILAALGKSSTAKYETLQDWAGEGMRVRGGLLYHGCGTGRWSGKGPQIQNFPRGTVKDDPEMMWAFLSTKDRDLIVSEYGGVMPVLSSALRGVIVPAAGSELFVGDYAGIEPRVDFWLAGDEDALDIIRSGRDIYCELAADIFKRPVSKKDKDERQLGKAGVIACGYGMGVDKFMDTASKAPYFLSLDQEFGQTVIDTYRTKFWRVRQLWYDLESAAIQAVKTKQPVPCGYVTWSMSDDKRFLYCTLPGGKNISYPDPVIQQRKTPWGAMKPCLTYMGVDPYTTKWSRLRSYGGHLCENLCQSISRNLMADAMVRLEGTGKYRVVFTVHDELVSEASIGVGDVKEYEHLMATTPAWAAGLPVAVEAFGGVNRYKK